MTALHRLVRPDGVAIAWRRIGDGPPPLVLLHATLSSAAQLERLAEALVAPGDATALLVDRRGSGDSRLAVDASIDVAVHVADLLAVLVAAGVEHPVLVGHSYGGVVALEAAGRHPGLARSIVAYEPPYVPLAPAWARPTLDAVAARTMEAARRGGDAAAAETFLRAVGGDAAWEGLSPRARAYLEAQGAGATADAALLGVDPGSLGSIRAPVTILTGDDSEPVYGAIADVLLGRIDGAIRRRLHGLRHTAPITDPGPVAAAIRAAIGGR